MNKEEARRKYAMTEELLKAGNYRKALDILVELDEAFPYNKGVMYLRAVCLDKLDCTEQAMAIFHILVVRFNLKEAKEFLKSAKVDSKPLHDVGFWNLLSRHLSHEGRQLGITAIGYDVLGANANAVDIIAENFDFTSKAEYTLFDDGFEAVIWELAALCWRAEARAAASDARGRVQANGDTGSSCGASFRTSSTSSRSPPSSTRRSFASTPGSRPSSTPPNRSTT